MTFLPILERELRIRARTRANYWGRLMVGTAAIVACAPPLIWSASFTPAAQAGQGAFGALVSAAFLLCCAACLVTCDTISSERRDGTLGLLLLTRVKHLDVLLGKFASSGLTSLLSLIAFLPVLALPLLTGGVTGGEAARKLLALLNTLFFALSVGLWSSARGVERFRTSRAALLVLAAFVLLPLLIGTVLPGTHVELASPLTTLVWAGAGNYKISFSRCWLSFAVVQLASWALLARASACLRNYTGNGEQGNVDAFSASGKHQATGSPRTGGSAFPSGSSPTSSQISCWYCGRLNDAESMFCLECGTELRPRKSELLKAQATLSSSPSALHWLLRRRRGVKALLWLAAALGFFSFTSYGTLGRFFLGGPSIWWTFNIVTTAIVGALFAWASSRFFVEARRTGELELLLTTPVGAQQIVSAQWNVLLRLLSAPLAVMLLPLGLQILMLSWNRAGFAPVFWQLYPVTLVLSGVNTILGTFALCWVALWFGLRIEGQARVVLWTVLLTKAVPFGFTMGWWFLCYLLLPPMMQPVWSIMPWLIQSFSPQLIALLFFLWLIRLARRQLLRRSLRTEPLNPSEVIADMLQRVVAAIRRAREWRHV